VHANTSTMSATDGADRAPHHRGWPLHLYLVALVVVFVLVAVAGGLYGSVQANRDAKRAAQHDSAFWAQLAAKKLTEEIELLQGTVAATAANPGVVQVYATPDQCSLSWAWSGPMGGGHLDLIQPDGSILCSSLGDAAGPGYRGADWLTRAATAPAFLGPVTDPATGKSVFLAIAPVPGHGMILAAVELAPVGPALSSTFNSPKGLEFFITTADGNTALARSIHPAQWVAAPLAGRPFDVSGATSARPDVDGTSRFYGRATVSPVGWMVFAGVDRSVALAAANRLFRRELAIILAGLVLICIGTFLVYRRITSPIRSLGGAVRNAAQDPAVAGVTVRGPAEIVDLAENFNHLLAEVDRELGERRRAEEALRASEHSYRLLFEANPRPMWLYDPDTMAFLEVNDAAVSSYGYSRDQFRAMTIEDLSPSETHPEAPRSSAVQGTVLRPTSNRLVRKDGSLIDVEMAEGKVSFAGRQARLVMAEDVTEKLRLERRLRQSERMESLGQLAGGIAHDFNNLITVISGFASFVGENVSEAANDDAERWEPVHRDVVQIERAAERAGDLTHQLLAFARREAAEPAEVNLNTVVSDIEELLRRTLGEDIDLVTDLAPDLSMVMADAGQMGQVLVNLAVNARDAMPSGGRLRIDTNDIMVDETFSEGRPGLSPGPYVQLRVSDTGVGMDRDVLERAFEPFFTTKASGEGNGLGLATVFGIIAQAGGDVLIYSEPGMGTSFRALFPAASTSAASVHPASPTPAPAVHDGGGSETILVVENEDAIREVAKRILGRNGFSVIIAGSGREALEAAQSHPGPIHLLLTDLILPQMHGRDVADQISELRPEIGVLFMSGYNQAILEGSKGSKERLVEKPFTEPTLISRVREALDARRVAP
jgi:PAS domain S-box-containing protein